MTDEGVEENEGFEDRMRAGFEKHGPGQGSYDYYKNGYLDGHERGLSLQLDGYINHIHALRTEISVLESNRLTDTQAAFINGQELGRQQERDRITKGLIELGFMPKKGLDSE